MKHYVINIVSDLRQASGFAAGTPVSSTIKAHRHDIAELLLNTLTLLFLFFAWQNTIIRNYHVQ